jgi:predicted amino acid racemase
MKKLKKKLEEYKQVTDISKVGLNTHLRYFTKNTKTGKQMFRLGGFLSKVNLTQGYVVLNNGNLSWSVQLKNSIFFEKMSFTDFKKQLKKAYDKKYRNKITKLQTENEKLKKAIKEIKKKYRKK